MGQNYTEIDLKGQTKYPSPKTNLLFNSVVMLFNYLVANRLGISIPARRNKNIFCKLLIFRMRYNKKVIFDQTCMKRWGACLLIINAII